MKEDKSIEFEERAMEFQQKIKDEAEKEALLKELYVGFSKLHGNHTSESNLLCSEQSESVVPWN